MAKVFRYMAAVIAGMIVALALLVAVEGVSFVVHPLPPGSKQTTEEMCLHVARYPHWVLALVVPAWAGTAFAATWISGRIGNRVCALVVGLLLMAGLVINVSMLPYTLWFKIVILLVVPVAIFWGDRWSSRRVAPVAETRA